MDYPELPTVWEPQGVVLREHKEEPETRQVLRTETPGTHPEIYTLVLVWFQSLRTVWGQTSPKLMTAMFHNQINTPVSANVM